jgi:hypothetical protein
MFYFLVQCLNIFSRLNACSWIRNYQLSTKKTITENNFHHCCHLCTSFHCLLWLYSLIKPSVKRAAFETAIVETGPMQATLAATGVVIPEYEQLITSP